MDKALADCLFAPFAELSVPKHCDDGSRLCSLLKTPLNAHLEHIIPTSDGPLSLLFSGGTAPFSGTLARYSYLQLCSAYLFSVLRVAASQPVTAQMSEMTWCGWWDALTRSVATAAAYLCGIDIRTDRDVQDSSITIDDKRRDFLLWGRSVLIMGGEHKRAGHRLPSDELAAKHKGANASLYGQLEFILLYASAGPLFQLYAMPVAGTHTLVPIGGAGHLWPQAQLFVAA